MSEPPDLETLARRYLDLWQDQVSALAADPEFTETLGRLMQVSASLGPAGWMSLWTAAATGLKPQKPHHGHSAQSSTAQPGPVPTPWPAPAAAPHSDGGDDVAELRRRIAALEAKLGEVERLGKAGTGNARVRRHAPDAGVAGQASVAQDGSGAGGHTPARPRRRRS